MGVGNLQEATFAIRGMKIITGRPFLPGDHFSFEIEGSEGAPVPPRASVEISPTAGQVAQIDFGAVTFTSADVGKQYTYVAREAFEDAPGFTYDTPRQIVRVAVADDESGLQLVVSYGETGADRGMVFSSRYFARGVAEISAIKDLQGRDWTESDVFEFALGPTARGTYEFGAYQIVEGGAGIPMPSEAHVCVTREHRKVTHRQHFAEPWRIPFSIRDLHLDPFDGIMKGDFFYEMKELLPAGAVANPDGSHAFGDLVYTDAVHTVHVHVEDNRRGALAVSVHYDEAERSNPATAVPRTPVFANVSTMPAPTAERAQRKVAVVDGVSGAILQIVPVRPGGSIDLPEPPVHAGYRFAKWVGQTAGIEIDTVVVATYIPDFESLLGLAGE